MEGLVKAHGPLDARVAWVGEAPGQEEVRKGIPFIGPSGHMARSTIAWAGIDVTTDVRFMNAVAINPGTFPSGKAGDALIAAHAPGLAAKLAEMTSLKVIVACGGVALKALCGLDNITNWRGSVLRDRQRVPVIPVLHPAGIMRSKGRDDIWLLRRDVQKVAGLLAGSLRRVPIELDLDAPDGAILEEVEYHGVRIYFDTEYNPETKEVYWIGFTLGGKVYGRPWNAATIRLVGHLLGETKMLKCAHNIHADVKVLAKYGIEVNGPWYDTMVGMHTLHPSLDVGLDDAARFYLEDVSQWKQMDHDDPMYNAMDVAYGYNVMLAQLREAADRHVDVRDELRTRMELLKVTYAMEQGGMHVDKAKQLQLTERVDGEIEELRKSIEQEVAPLWGNRIALAEGQAAAYKAQVEVLQQNNADCPKHPTYNGIRKPAATCIHCIAFYNLSEPRRAEIAQRRKLRVMWRANAERWAESGFVARNNEHLRWLLYDPTTLNLPPQYQLKTRKLTADRQAIDKLLRVKVLQNDPKSMELVKRIKAIQHLEKARSTFLDVPLDHTGVAHPPYKVHGTRTGRLAGGSDDDERADNAYAYNALNIPAEWRLMYCAPPGHVLIYADWRNVEGRLTAMFCKDPFYAKALNSELTGGPKVHSINAGIIYGIDPKDAKTHMVPLGGQLRPAYDGGKKLTHAWSYGMQPRLMSSTFDISMKEALAISQKLAAAYPILVSWRDGIVEDVLGTWVRVPGERRMVCTKPGKRILANPFGWQLHFMSVDGAQANEVIAFLPQSTGAGMWSRVAIQLHALKLHIYTGTYDSFALVARAEEALAVAQELKRIMEQPWKELENRTFPCEVAVGRNWGAYDPLKNVDGLREVDV